MAKEGQTSGLEGIARAAKGAGAGGPGGLPPMHLWNPPFCGDIAMRIAADGTWYYQGAPIGRPALVKLFASVLKREGERYFLVTPVEKCGITVEDVPFLAVEMQVEGPAVVGAGAAGRVLTFRTNTEDWVVCSEDHPLRFERQPATGGIVPYLLVRADLWAKVTRALFYDLVALGEERVVDGVRMFGVVSCGQFFAMAPAAELADLTDRHDVQGTEVQ